MRPVTPSFLNAKDAKISQKNAEKRKVPETSLPDFSGHSTCF